jgi:hypothetical protein
MPDLNATAAAETQELEASLDTAFTGGLESPAAPPSGEPTPHAGSAGAEATPPAAPVVQPQAPSVSPSLLARAQKAGLPLDGISTEADLAQAILDRYLEDQPYAQHGRASLTATQPKGGNVQGDESQRQEDEGNEQEFDVDGHFNSLWNVPAIDAQGKFAIDNGIVKLNPETGLYEAAPGFEVMALPLLNGLNQAHVASRQNVQNLFAGNPIRTIYDGMTPAVKHMIQQELKQHFQQYETKQQTAAEYQKSVGFVEKFETENATWLFDANKQLTPKGQEFSQAVEALRADGITNPQRLADLALKLIGGAPAPAAPAVPTPTPAAAERPRGPDGKFLPAAAVTETPPPPTKQESFLERAKRNAAVSSNTSGIATGNQQVVPANQGEVDSMFSTAWQQKTGAAA